MSNAPTAPFSQALPEQRRHSAHLHRRTARRLTWKATKSQWMPRPRKQAIGSTLTGRYCASLIVADQSLPKGEKCKIILRCLRPSVKMLRMRRRLACLFIQWIPVSRGRVVYKCTSIVICVNIACFSRTRHMRSKLRSLGRFPGFVQVWMLLHQGFPAFAHLTCSQPGFAECLASFSTTCSLRAVGLVCEAVLSIYMALRQEFPPPTMV